MIDIQIRTLAPTTKTSITERLLLDQVEETLALNRFDEEQVEASEGYVS